MDAGDLLASVGRVARLPMAAPPDFSAEVHRRRGHDHDEGLGYWEKARASSG
jgi:hypothetical protein